MNKFILFSLIFALSLHTDIKNINVYKNIMETLKKYLPDLLVVVVFAVISFAYFFPADTEGRILYRHDASAGQMSAWYVLSSMGIYAGTLLS